MLRREKRKKKMASVSSENACFQLALTSKYFEAELQ